MTAALSTAAVAIGQSLFLSALVKATACLAAGLAATRLLGRARAAVRHAVLAATFAATAVMPALMLVAPPVDVPVALARASAPPPAPGGGTSMATTSAAAAGGTSASGSARAVGGLPAALVGIWLFGVIVVFWPQAYAMAALRELRRASWPFPGPCARAGGQVRARPGAPVEVLCHEAVGSPITFGVWRPAIVLPDAALGWSADELDRVLVHEREHVRRRDWAVQMAARAVCTLYWCHPLVWVAWRRLGLEAERACDDAVVASHEGTTYARQLVELATRLNTAGAAASLGMARQSDLATRVTALLDPGQTRGRAGMAAALAAAAMLAPAGVLSPLRAVEAAARSDRSAPDAAQPSLRTWPGALDAALYEAASEGDSVEVSRLLAAGANPNTPIPGDGSALIAAARAGDLALARVLLQAGADPNLPVPGDGSALIAAAQRGHTDMVAFLLDAGASVDQVVNGDENALIQAAGSGRLDAVRLLLARGADVNSRVLAPTYPAGAEWRTPLGMARRGRHTDVVAFLIAAGARP
ncbi:MAG: M56 family metallopeptidase [Vicinamibacterales bacterium]